MSAARPEPSRRGRALTLAVSVIVALLPALAALPLIFSERAAEFLPWTDHALLELRVRGATESLQQLGPYSRFNWHHPGPFYFYVLAPAYALSGHATRAIWAAVWTLNALCLAGTVCVVQRAGGRGHALVTALLLALQTRVLGAEKLCDPWNPVVIVLPFELLAFTCAAVGAGNAGILPLAALVASFVVQTHVGTAPAVLALVFAAVLSALLQRGTDAELSRWFAWRRGLAISAGVMAVLWAPVVFEQVSAPTGNLTKLVRFFASQSDSHAFRETYAAVSRHFSTLADIEGHRLLSNTSFVHPVSPVAAQAMAVMVVLLVLACVLGRVRRDAYAVAGASVALIGTAVALFSCTRIVGPLWSYLFLWTTGLGTLSAALIAGEAGAWLLRGLRRLRSGLFLKRVRTSWAIPVALLIAADALRVAIRDHWPVPYYYGRPASDITALSAPIAEQIRSRRWTKPLVRIAAHDTWGIAAGVLLALSKERIPFFIEEEYLFMFGSDRRVRAEPDGLIVFGDRAFDEQSGKTRGRALLKEHGGTFVYAGKPR